MVISISKPPPASSLLQLKDTSRGAFPEGIGGCISLKIIYY
jgi:hypothetical protein